MGAMGLEVDEETGEGECVVVVEVEEEEGGPRGGLGPPRGLFLLLLLLSRLALPLLLPLRLRVLLL